MRLIGSSKSTANGLVMALVAGLLGTGVAVVGAASPAHATTCTTTATSFGGGDGTSDNPFEISTKDHLVLLSTSSGVWRGKHFKQTGDIDLGSCDWSPIGKAGDVFSGTYDGDSKRILGLRITTSAVQEIGLFGVISQTTIRNLAVRGSITSNRNFVGGLVGKVPSSQSSTISQVKVNVDIAFSGGNYAGGIAGEFLSGSFLTFSVYEGLLSSSNSFGSIGGLTGFGGGAVESSYARASFSGNSTYKAGLNGWNSPLIRRSYSVGPGADAGITNSGISGSSVANFWDVEIPGAAPRSDRLLNSSPITHASTAGLSTDVMRDVNTFSATNWRIVDGWEQFSTAGWTNFSILPPSNARIWGICSRVNDGYPFLLWEYTSNPCVSQAPPEVNNPSTSSGPAMSIPSAEVADVTLGAGGRANQTLVRVRLNRIPSSSEQFFIVVRLLDLRGVLIREIRVPVEPSTSSVEIPVDKQMGQFNVVALTSNAAGATAAVSLNPQTVRQSNIRKATENAPKRLSGRSLNKDVIFTADSAALSPQMKRTLRQAARLAKDANSRVAVTGFASASAVGTKFEKRLAERRALRVANFLRKQGFENWIFVQGLNSRRGGEFLGQPRRVEIRVLK